MNKHTGSTYLEGTYPSLLSAMASKTYQISSQTPIDQV